MKQCGKNRSDNCQVEVICGCDDCDNFIAHSRNIIEELKHQTMERNIVRYSTPELVAELRKRSEVRAIDVDGFYEEFFITTSKEMDEDEIEESCPAIILIIK